MRLARIATNPNGYRVHAGAVSKRYAPDENQATPAKYYISDHNFNLNILLSYGSVIGNNANIVYSALCANQYCSTIASFVYVAANHHYAYVDYRRAHFSVLLQLPFRHKPMCGDASDLISLVNVLIPQSRHC